jgi:Phage tail assembly chaperone protein
MMDCIYCHIVDGAVVAVLDGPADAAVAVSEVWVSPTSLAPLSDSELHAKGLVRAQRQHPTIDTATHTETGYQPEPLADGSWAYVMRSRPLTDAELSDARGRAMTAFRQRRNTLLASTDAVILRHADETALGGPTTLTIDQHRDLLVYRKALRDLPATVTDPAAVVWPVNPLT